MEVETRGKKGWWAVEDEVRGGKEVSERNSEEKGISDMIVMMKTRIIIVVYI